MLFSQETWYVTLFWSSFFKTTKRRMNEDQHNVTYHVSCEINKCTCSYVGQTRCLIIKRTLEHNSKDNVSHILIHSKATKHRREAMKKVKILGRRYKCDFKRRISESLFIKMIKPDLKKQKDTFKLKLYIIDVKDTLCHIRRQLKNYIVPLYSVSEG